MKQGRRQFIQAGGLAGAGALMPSDLLRLINAIAKQTISNARADATESSTRNYLNVHLQGGPARWLFDQLLTPNATDETLSRSTPSSWHDAFATAFNQGNLEYRTVNYRGLRVPHHYALPVRTSTGLRNTTDILDHMAIIRGSSSGVDGHELNSPLQLFPDPAAPSINGLVADGRSDLISAVGTSLVSYPFSSGKAKASITVSDHTSAGGTIYGLMKSYKKYIPSTASLANIDSIVTGSKEYFSDLMKAHMDDSNSSASSLRDHAEASKKLVEFAAEDLVGAWNSIYNKYLNTINSSADIFSTGPGGAIPGLTDQPQYLSSTMNNMWDGTPMDRAQDLRETVRGTYVDTSLARTLALMEYCMTRGISGNVSGGCTGGAMTKFINASGSTVQYGHMPHDAHFITIYPQIFANTATFRGLIAGLLELIDVLKSTSHNGKTLFDDTIIHITGDFGRNPSNNGEGTQHGYMAGINSIISGIVPQPTVVGNIMRDGTFNYGDCRGAWGRAADVDFNGMKETLTPRHVAAAVANALGAENPWVFTNLVWRVENGVLVPKVGAKLV